MLHKATPVVSTTLLVLSEIWGWIENIRLAEWIGIAGFFLAVHGRSSQLRRVKRDAHRQEVLAIIAKLRATCDEASEEISRHLCFQKARKTKEDIYRILNRAKHDLNALQSRLPSRKADLLEAYTTWYAVVTGDGFPVDRKTAAFKSTDERVRATFEAQTQLCGFIDKLRLDCLSDRVKYWP